MDNTGDKFLAGLKAEAIAAWRTEEAPKLLARYELGRIVLAIQAHNGDIAGNNQPTYAPARAVVLEWLKEAGNIEVTNVILEQATYIAKRVNKADIKTLNEAGWKFGQVYCMLIVNADKVRRVSDIIKDVRDGKKVDPTKWQKMKYKGLWTNGKNRQVETEDVRVRGDGEEAIVHAVITGGESEDDCLNIVTSVLSAVRRLGYDHAVVAEEGVKRVNKMVGKQ